MSMLSEQRRKTKWVINPTKKPIWSTDSSGIKFGKQLMEKMGWSAGKGLGLNEQGIQEPLKVSFKNDTKGMGFKGNDDDWIEHQDEFNILLNQLRNNDDTSVVKSSDVEKNEIQSLEEKSKQSKARVHYQKFTRGKDLSKYSENDLACILGTSKIRKKEKQKSKEVIKNETKINGNFETSFGVTTINSGSIDDYFKKKWTVDKVKKNDFSTTADEGEENFRPSFSSGNSFFSGSDIPAKKSEGEEQEIHKKHKSEYEKDVTNVEQIQKPDTDETESSEGVGKKRRNKHKVEVNSEEEPECKKCRKNSLQCELSAESVYKTEVKRKKEKNCLTLEFHNDEMELRKEIKVRIGTKSNLGQVPNDEVEINKNSSLELDLPKKKKKKKDKKEGLIESEYIDIAEHINKNMNESDLEEESIKIKKKKKGETVKPEKIENKDPSNNHMRDSCLEISNSKEINAYQNEKTVELESGKKKMKKKDKKEKILELDTNEVSCNGKKACLKAVTDKSYTENTVVLESRNKKKKKKDKKEKVEKSKEVEKGGCDDQIKESCLEESTEKIYAQSNVEELENELVKKKKKKKDKKEKIAETESKTKENCLKEENIEEENAVDVDYVVKKKKKKKKKNKKEKKEYSNGIENKDEQSSYLKEVEETSVGVKKKIKEASEVTGYQTDLNVVNNGVLSANTREDRIQKLRTNLFPDKAAEKYFPEQGTNERVLKLIRWANIAEFKGSNLGDVEGYGRRKMCEKQSSAGGIFDCKRKLEYRRLR